MNNIRVLFSCLLLAISSFAYFEIGLDDVVNLGKWSKADLLTLVNQQNYSYHLNLLREKLTDAIMKNSVDALEPDLADPIVLASLTESYVVIFINSNWQMVDENVRQAFDRVLKNVVMKEFSPKIIGNEAQRELKSAAEKNVYAALKTIGLDPQTYSGVRMFEEFSKRFYSLFSLAYMSQPRFCEYFNRLYREISDALVDEGTTLLLTEEFVPLLNTNIGQGSGVENSWEVSALKRILSLSR